MISYDPSHPHALSQEDRDFLTEMTKLVYTAYGFAPSRTEVIQVSQEQYEKLEGIMGRIPSYELVDPNDPTSELDYTKPIKVNLRLTDPKLAEQGVENILFKNRPFTYMEMENKE